MNLDPTTGVPTWTNIGNVSGANVSVVETGYTCTVPITVTGNTINIASSSNAYGRKFVSSTDPALSGTICNGDIWYDTSGTADSSGFPAGTTLLFYQAAAPTGWTQVTTQNNKALRVVSGTGGGSGGTTAFTTVFASRSVPLLQHTHGITDPGHVHSYTRTTTGTDTRSGGDTHYINADTANTVSATTGISIDNAGTAGATMDFAVQYIDVILCSKN